MTHQCEPAVFSIQPRIPWVIQAVQITSDDYGDYYDDSDDYEPSADDPYYKEIVDTIECGRVLYHRLAD